MRSETQDQRYSLIKKSDDKPLTSPRTNLRQNFLESKHSNGKQDSDYGKNQIEEKKKQQNSV